MAGGRLGSVFPSGLPGPGLGGFATFFSGWECLRTCAPAYPILSASASLRGTPGAGRAQCWGCEGVVLHRPADSL